MDTLSKKIIEWSNGISQHGKYHYFRKKITPFAFVGPALLLLGIVLLYPLLYSLKISLHQWNMLEQSEPIWIGLGNYLRILGFEEFWSALGLQLSFVVIAVIFELIIGFAVAILFNREFWGSQVARALLLLPIFVLPVVSGMTFRFIFNPQYGAANFFLEKLGLGAIEWLSHPKTAFMAIIIQDIWRMWPFMFIILYAGLSGLPKETFEAAYLDGASKWNTLVHITIPLLKPTILIAIILRTVDALKAFPEIFVMTGGGPGTSTTLLSVHIYKYAFNFWDMGYASAASYILVFIALIFTTFLVKNMYRE